ncbi:unnamed protein product [Protopolystoma xenopodis]|uniref:Uncharacterized protein n=1 Tax=Protopolystoma xenopodis TaxID=117903 RepID=A0A448WCX9_9PLAT|nr:unnamed protein product [Protopolystoma xenopodis]
MPLDIISRQLGSIRPLGTSDPPCGPDANTEGLSTNISTLHFMLGDVSHGHPTAQMASVNLLDRLLSLFSVPIDAGSADGSRTKRSLPFSGVTAKKLLEDLFKQNILEYLIDRLTNELSLLEKHLLGQTLTDKLDSSDGASVTGIQFSGGKQTTTAASASAFFFSQVVLAFFCRIATHPHGAKVCEPLCDVI